MIIRLLFPSSQGYVGQATRLSYRWNTCASSTVNSHLSAQGLWGILSEMQSGGVHATNYQLADFALAHAAAWQRASLRQTEVLAGEAREVEKAQKTDKETE